MATNQIRTLDFLPEVFQTETNAQFLAATLDQLVAQPKMNRVEGFIGQKYGYAVEKNDRYVVEPTQTRSDYQLDPAVVFLKTETQKAKDFINYPGMVNALKQQGAITKNNNRLFENEFYSWDSFIDLDMIVNYSQYYWIPNGPDAVSVTTATIYNTQDYKVTDNGNSFSLTGFTQTNPTITLLRGGTYTFDVDQTSQFWIQGVPGLTGYGLNQNISTREVLGVDNNGASVGKVTFTVPQKDAQQQYNLSGNYTTDMVTTLQFSDIDGQTTTTVGNIDGVTQLDGKTLMFYNNGDLTTQIYYYAIGVDTITNIITLTPVATINNNERIVATSGTIWVGRQFYRDDTGLINIVPYLSSILDRLYYQDGSDARAYGIINIVDSNDTNAINIDEILGRSSYISPNGVELINGLKIIFNSSTIPELYSKNEYYVEGVGSAINLIPVTEMLSVESKDSSLYLPWQFVPWNQLVWDQLIYMPLQQDYIVINRDSRDRNAWSRGNRWFNTQVIEATIKYNGQLSTLPGNTATRAIRPIIQFDGNLGLYDYGTKSLGFVDLFDTVTTDAFLQVVGQTTYTIDGQIVVPGQTVVFNADTNEGVRQSVYTIGLAPVGPNDSLVLTLTPTPRIRWWLETANATLDSSLESIAVNNDQIYIASGQTYAGTAWRFSRLLIDDPQDGSWVYAQQKTSTNQAPLFDIYDENGFSLSDQAMYPSSTFQGCYLFSYTQGTGAADPVLGFPIAYSSAASIGDIEFTVNLNSDTFTYQQNLTSITDLVSMGYVYYYPIVDQPVERTGWVDAAAPSVQPQVFEFDVTTAGTQLYICDVPANIDTVWKNIVVYYNSDILDSSKYTATIDSADNTTTIVLATPTTVNDKITILIISDVASSTGYYEIPTNLQNNPFNTNITIVNVGDLKNQYTTMFNNSPDTTGPVFGPNNVYNLGNLNKYGTAIIQNSASLVLPGVFLRDPQLNLFEALQYNSDQYIDYKTLLVSLTDQNDFSIYTTPSQMLDTVLYQITTVKNSTDSFFWSDMLPSGSPYVTNTYSTPIPLNTVTYPLSTTYNFASANFNGVLVYLNTTVSGQKQQFQLISGTEYVISDISPSVTINYAIQAGDSITIKEYNQTYGTYCPNTPTKLGLYQSFVPQIYLDNTYTIPTYFLIGHDGSYNKLYGTYTNGVLADFRDKVLLEFESRVYNNLKISSPVPLTGDQVIPGQFRTTDYLWEEVLEIYQTNFLKWVGANRIDYKSQVYSKANQFTYNYNQATIALDGESPATLIKQGYWRGVYNWFYDTSNPANAPWEMLGLTDEPTWWTQRYGVGPYTSDNTYMWEDIAAGYIWNDGAPYVNSLKIRPELLEALPVNAAGTLLSPLVNVVGNYNSLTFQRDWIVGDQGPAETSYLRSSSWPFDLMRILALTKPAQFFNLNVDRDLYRYNTTFHQYLYNDRYHLDPRQVVVYGNGVSKASYVNWVVDFINQRGVNGTDYVTQVLQNIDVRLTYNLAGFSSKQYLNFLIEKSTPNSQNSTLMIPDNSYAVLLYDNPPEDKIVYSSVIVQRVKDGWTVWGNSKLNPYFTLAVPKGGVVEQVSQGNATVTVSNEFYDNKTVSVPYGQVFYTIQGVSEFIRSYGVYLVQQGMIFNYSVDTKTFDWTQMIREYLAWVQQDWQVGSTIALNPSAKLNTVYRPGLIVQPLTLQQQNFVLNQNLVPLQTQNQNVIREQETFTVQVLSEGDTIAFTNYNLASIEHAVVFDNTTVFNDIIYDLVTGLRQERLLLQGNKSAEWSGYMNAQGFLINEDNIKEWVPNVKYPSGVIITYKGQYWVANRLIEPQAEFSKEQWYPTTYDKIQTGLLPNPSTNAYESLYYYDTSHPSLYTDEDLSSYSLIGYRPRQYLADADLSVTTQVGIYQQLIQYKGTNLIANAFKKADLLQGQIDYDLKENWSIKTATFGSVNNSNFVEFRLDETLLTGNPTLIGFTDNRANVVGVQQNINIATDLINWEMPPQSANFLPPYPLVYNDERGLPTAGYVNLNDVKFTAYELADLNQIKSNVETLYRSDCIWIASYRGSWNVFTPTSVQTQITECINNLNGTVTITFAQAHNLAKNDPVMIFNFDDRINGYYEVQDVPSSTQIVITINLSAATLKITAQGLCFKLVSRRFTQASDMVYSTVPYSSFYARNSWVDENNQNQWAVWQAAPIYTPVPFSLTQTTAVNNIGAAVAYSTIIGTVTSDPLNGQLVRQYPDPTDPNGGVLTQTITLPETAIGQQLIAKGSWLFASDSVHNKVYVFKVDPTFNFMYQVSVISQQNTGALAVSNDLNWLYVGDATTQSVKVYGQIATGVYSLVNTIVGPTTAEGFGTSLATDITGTKLIVGAPLETITPTVGTPIDNCGAAYVYSRSVERFTANGTSYTYQVSQAIPAGYARVYINDVLDTQVQVTSAGAVSFMITPPAFDDIIEVSYGAFTLQQRITSQFPINGGNFGQSVSTNKFGAQFVVGCPNELATANKIANVQGAVYKYTNSGQQYGSITGVVKKPVVGVLFIDGFKVNFNGSAAAIAQQINTQTPYNILAVAQGTALTISVYDGSVEEINNIVDVTADTTTLTNLGLTLYTQTQIITSPTYDRDGNFGYLVAMGTDSSLIVSNPEGTPYSETTFDRINVNTYSGWDTTNWDINAWGDDNYQFYAPSTSIDTDTLFDNGATTFIDGFQNIGVVYEFNYLPAANENIMNPGQYVFGQYIDWINSDSISLQPNFGISIANNDGVIVVGASDWFNNTDGLVVTYVPYSQATSWWIDKAPLPMVSVNNLNNISIYDTINNTTLAYLDYIDPVQGKLLGAVTTNLDYISSSDPAVYNDGVVWTVDHVGKTWLDTTNLRMLNYNQPDLVYNASNWGKAFPGSLADIYTWVESPLQPVEYQGNGIIVDFNNYTTTRSYDRSTNAMVTNYYFWVKTLNTIPPGKTLSPQALSQYILNPINSGIPFLAALTTNAIALMNNNTSIQNNSSALHLGYAIGASTDQKHTSWTLIEDNNKNEFLPGLPSAANQQPTDLYAKFLDSFAGQTRQGLALPSQRLPILNRYGTDQYQTMFVNRAVALQNYIEYANNILIKLPIAESRSLYFLNKSGQGWDTADFYTLIDWYAPGYSSKNKVLFEVQYYNDLKKLQPNEIIPNTESLQIGLQEGMIARVTGNANGLWEDYVYSSALGWTRIALQNGTVQLLSNIYTELTGWDEQNWDILDWDQSLAEETYWIIRWLNEECYINDLQIERNNSLILMFDYIASEALEQQNYLPWLNKTSLINVSHKVRDLLPYKKFQQDNQEFLSGYLNEIKPFHVKINDFLFTYDAFDEYLADPTDFDLPATYNTATAQFESPQLVYQQQYANADQYLPDASIWKQPEYSEWFNHYGLSIIDDLDANIPAVTVIDGARGYLTAPVVTMSIDTSLFPAPRAAAVLNSALLGDALSTITVAKSGNGYATEPTMTIQPSSIVGQFAAENVNAVFNTITITAHKFETGDPVVYSSGLSTQSPKGLTQATYYYVRSIDVNTIALYDSKASAFNSNKSEFLDLNRIVLVDQGSGTNNFLRVTAVATFATTSKPVREITTTIKFDRISYGSKITEWSPAGFYAGLLVDIGTESSSTLLVDSTLPWDYLAWDATPYSPPMLASAQGARFPITSIDNYRVGTGVVTMNLNYGETVVCPGQLNGQKVQLWANDFEFASWGRPRWSSIRWAQKDRGLLGWKDMREFYVQVRTSTEIALYYDANFNHPVQLADFPYSPGDTIFLPEPFTFQRSMVTYAGKLWKCVISNRNTQNTFNYDDWEQIFSDDRSLTAADRIAAFYAPTVNMTGRDLRQLMSGIEYPDATFLGTPFSYSNQNYDMTPYDSNLYDQDVVFDIDTNLTSPAFNADLLTNPTVYDVQGGVFQQGYGPEEMVPGLVTDTLEFTVITDPATLPAGKYIDFRIQVDKFGSGEIYNINPFTQTVLAQDFVSTGTISDVIYVDDVTKLVVITTQNVVTNSLGIAVINGLLNSLNAPITLNIPNAFTTVQLPNAKIELIIQGISSPTPIVATTATGDELLINSEFIKFTKFDLALNCVSGLLRGRKGTITNTFVESGAIVQSVLARDKLPQQFYNQWWYNIAGWDYYSWDSYGYAYGFENQTLEQSTTDAAIFLKRTAP
jgi:hypothetical protein